MMRACLHCAWAGLPVRDVCPRCKGTEWTGADRMQGEVVETTRVFRAFGETFEPARPLALVLLAGGGYVIARVGEDVLAGEAVVVDQQMQARSVE